MTTPIPKHLLDKFNCENFIAFNSDKRRADLRAARREGFEWMFEQVQPLLAGLEDISRRHEKDEIGQEWYMDSDDMAERARQALKDFKGE